MKKFILFAMAAAICQCTNAQSIFSGLGKPVPTSAKQESTLMFSSRSLAVSSDSVSLTDNPILSTVDSLLLTLDSTTVFYTSPQNVFRIVTNVGTYGFTGNGFRVMAGVGIGYQHYLFDATNQKWVNNWGVAILQYAGGNISPTKASQVAATGVSFSYGLYSVGLAKDGAVWQFTTSNPVYLTIGANFPLFANKK